MSTINNQLGNDGRRTGKMEEGRNIKAVGRKRGVARSRPAVPGKPHFLPSQGALLWQSSPCCRVMERSGRQDPKPEHSLGQIK